MNGGDENGKKDSEEGEARSPESAAVVPSYGPGVIDSVRRITTIHVLVALIDSTSSIFSMELTTVVCACHPSYGTMNLVSPQD